MATKLYTTTQIRSIEQQAIAHVCSEFELMQRAGRAAFKQLYEHYPKARRIVFFCGKGNNGGDGYVVAAMAQEQGIQCEVRHIGALEAQPSAASEALQACRALGVPVRPYHPAETIAADVLVDALLGIGISGDVKEEYRAAIQTLNQLNIPKFAIDVPSGIHADTGRVCGSAVRAECTVTFIGMKRGLLTGQAPAYCGELVCDDLNLPGEIGQTILPAAETLSADEFNLTPRRLDANKGDFGHVLVIGGNYGMGGAVHLASVASARTGAGLVSVATRPEHITAIIATRPEVMAHAVSSAADLAPLLARATVIVLGPGLGQDSWAKSLYLAAMASPQPKVVDADALNLLAQNPSQNPAWILTPHPGEAARLLQCSTHDIQHDRFAAAKQLQQRYGGVVVLKGVGSIVQALGHPRLCTAGNPGMASGGMGDVLSGVIGGLLAQGLPLAEAAGFGVWLHATAADRAAARGQRGLLALDVVAELRAMI